MKASSVKKPKNIHIHVDEERLEIVVHDLRGKDVRDLFYVGLILFLVNFIYWWEEGFEVDVTSPGVITAVALQLLFILYYCSLKFYKSRTFVTIRVDRHEFSIRRDEHKNQNVHRLTLPTREVGKIFWESRPGSRNAELTYDLMLQEKKGGQEVLIEFVDDLSEVEFLKQQIEAFLNKR